MHIGAVATRTGLSLRTLRHYDDIGLLRPSGRSEGGFRLYTEDDVDRVLVIRRMKPLGFTLEEMTAAMRDLEDLRAATGVVDGVVGAGAADGAADGAKQARARLALLQQQAVERRERLADQLVMADEFIASLGHQLA